MSNKNFAAYHIKTVRPGETPHELSDGQVEVIDDSTSYVYEVSPEEDTEFRKWVTDSFQHGGGSVDVVGDYPYYWTRR